MNIGYARTSTKDQILDLQLDALKKADCDKVFSDQLSGASRDRPGLKAALEFARGGDVLIVWKLDRLGRSIKDLLMIAEELSSKGIELRSVTDAIDTSTATGRFFFHLLAALSQMERELSRERVQAGIEAARRRGRIGGRPRKMTKSKIRSAEILIAQGTPVSEVAQTLGVAVSTLYAWLPTKGGAGQSEPFATTSES